MDAPSRFTTRPAASLVLAALGAVLLASACSPSISIPSSSSSSPPGGATAKASPASRPTSGSAQSAPTPGPASSGSFDAVHAAAVAAPAVAMIIVQTGSGVAQGSGVAFQSGELGSFILTNNHVVAGGSRVQVLMPDGSHFDAKVAGTDAHEDLAVLQAPGSLPVAQFGDSTRLQVGQSVLAIGSPLGNQSSVSAGIISALHRSLSNVGGGAQAESLPDVLQTDAPINPGSSGGPLVDGNGLVVGINSAGSTNGSGIGFAIPSVVAKRVAENLAAGKAPADPFVGVCTQPIEAVLASGKSVDGYGHLVVGVVAGGPASQAGIRANDVIQGVAGVPLNNGMTLGGALQVHSAGDQVKFTVKRAGSLSDLNVQLGGQPSTPVSC
jgi:putative serine protease PepD